jgi:three-Cys-motif partner protein
MVDCAEVLDTQPTELDLETADELQLYKGREQSLIKHGFLSLYLQAAAFKTLQSRSNTFNYVDAFAGPWNVRDGDYSDSSFDQAIKMLEGVRATLGRNGLAGLKIRFCLCERNRAALNKLRAYAEQNKRYEIHIFEGRFEDNLDAIAKAIPDGFTFTFIDPTGWDIRNQAVFKFLRERGGDFLINFMADHINRHAGFEQVSKSFERFLDDPEWKERYSQLPEFMSGEERILALLIRKMKELRVAKFMPHFSILVPTKNRVKMRLVLGTNVPAGVEVFRDVQAKAELKQFGVRRNIVEEKTRQTSLFSNDFLAHESMEFGGKTNLKLAESKMLELLK